ncbi:MAG: hypothetical protein IJ893_08670 [Bacteroidales bacterium]|nr:hypothetical protein [Bacteroidales bacterium]
MKKIYVAMAVLGTVLLSSCVREKNFNSNIKMGENEIAFVMNGVSTRSGEEAAPAIKGVTIPMGRIANEGLYLEETIEYLNPEPATKGAPAYTVTLPDIYPTMGVYAEGNFGDAVFGILDEALYTAQKYEGSGFRYNHNYLRNPWPASETDKVNFYLRMPASGSGLVATENTFELTTPLNGQEQMDVLFGQVSMSKKEHDAKRPDGMPVTMKHALTGIKFRNGHENNTQTKTVITRVELVGLNMYGKGTIGADGAVIWDTTVDPVYNTKTNPFYLVFDNDSTYDPDAGATNPDGTVTTWDSSFNGTSWVGENAASDHNLNHSNGDLTFWFIPQEVPDDLVLNLEFFVKTPDTPEGTLVPHIIELGALLNGKYRDPDGDGTPNKEGNLEWKAGQLRTYTLKPLDVDVEIEDKISETVKSNLHIANTGNVDEYVRMMIMGNWYGWRTEAEMAANPNNPSILVGYKYENAAEAEADGGNVNDMVEAWYREGYDLDNDPSTPNVDPYGHFDGTFTLGSLGDTEDPNARDGKRNDWADASGGYYYTMPIGPGDGAFDDATSATEDLFKSYTVTHIPDIWIPVGNTRQKAVGVHLVMEIVIQAIAVPTDADGKRVWWLQAWYDATGVKKLDPEAARNSAYKALYTAGEYN